jgi:hypothetical protein
LLQVSAVTKRWLFPHRREDKLGCPQGRFWGRGKHKPYLTIQSRDYAVPGWPSWLGRETHRVNTIIARFLRHLEVAGSNPAPGT